VTNWKGAQTFRKATVLVLLDSLPASTSIHRDVTDERTSSNGELERDSE